MKIKFPFFFLILLFGSLVAEAKKVEQVHRLPKVLRDDDSEGTFVRMLGHWVHKAQCQKKPRFLVIMLSSVGCVGCQVFHNENLKPFLKKYGARIEMYSVDYFLEKSDLTAMALVGALQEKHRQKIYDIMLFNQKAWQKADSIVASMGTLLAQNGIILDEKVRAKWELLRLDEVEQRRFISTICTIEYLPLHRRPLQDNFQMSNR